MFVNVDLVVWNNADYRILRCYVVLFIYPKFEYDSSVNLKLSDHVRENMTIAVYEK